MHPHKRDTHARTHKPYVFIYLFMKPRVLNCKPLMTTGQCPRQAAVSALPTLCCVGMLGNWRTQGWGLRLQTLSFVGKPICPFRCTFSCESFSQGCKSSNCLFWWAVTLIQPQILKRMHLLNLYLTEKVKSESCSVMSYMWLNALEYLHD